MSNEAFDEQPIHSLCRPAPKQAPVSPPEPATQRHIGHDIAIVISRQQRMRN